MSNYAEEVTQLLIARFYGSVHCQLCGEPIDDEDFDDEVCNACSDRLEEELGHARDEN